MASVNRLALRLSRTRTPVSSFSSLQKRSYAIASTYTRPSRTTTSTTAKKPATAVKANTYATNTKSDELDAFADVNDVVDSPPESVPSSRVLQSADEATSSTTTDAISGNNGTLTALEGSNDGTTDWSRSYQGLGAQPFSKEAAEILLSPIDPLDIEMKPGMSSPYSYSYSFSFSHSHLYRRIDLPPRNQIPPRSQQSLRSRGLGSRPT